MKRLAILLAVQLLFCRNYAQEPVLIKDVNYFVTERGNFESASVYLAEGKIQRIAESIPVADTVEIIDGTGKYLIPGLIDAHIHLFQSGGLYTRPDVVDLRKYRSYGEETGWLRENAGKLLQDYLKLGITTVIDVGGPMANFRIREQFHNSTTHPKLYLTGPLVSTYQPEAFQIDDAPIIKANTPEEAIAVVQKQLPEKPDFIKIWYIDLPGQDAQSTYDIVEATIRESHKHNLKVAVHATELATAKLAIKAGADILVHSVADPLDEEFLRMIKENEVVYIPTLVVMGNYGRAFGGEFNPTAHESQYADPYVLGTFYDTKNEALVDRFKNFKTNLERNREKNAAVDSIRLQNLRQLQSKGVTIATGTDAGNIGTMHGASFLQEILAMQNAGFSNAEIIVASTLNGAKVLDKEADLGSIEIGKTADLVLLQADPLEDIRNLHRIDLVVKSGRVLEPEQFSANRPEDLAQRQLNAYNAGDIEAFLAPYAEDVEIYNFPAELRYKGKDTMRPQYQQFFEQVPDLHCELVKRIVKGNTVIDHERITGLPGGQPLEAIAVYQIENNQIKKVYFIR